jgi:hypothetical protein
MRRFLLAFFPLLCLAQPASKKLDAYLLMPEPAALKNVHSRPLGGAARTVLSPAHEVAEAPGVKLYSKEEFARLGISVETFTARAKARAEVRLGQMQPEFIKDDAGKTRYAVYRSDSSLIATLVMAPSLAKNAATLFGSEVWAVLPDRHSLYLFPASPELLAEFTEDLKRRYDSDPYAASCEVFLLKPGEEPKVVATFGD